MDYLTPSEKLAITYSNGYAFPVRPQTDIEKTIARIILIHGVPVEGATDKAIKEKELQRNFEDLHALTLSNRLGDKIKAAMVSPEKFEEFTDGYPYAKYHHLIDRKTPLSPIEMLAKDGFKINDIRALIGWIGMVSLTFHQDLPKGIDTFIWTPYTRYYRTHEMAKCSGDKAFYGYTLPTQTQNHINILFGTDGRLGSCKWMMTHVRRTGLHKGPVSSWERFGLAHIADELFGKGVEMNFGYDHLRSGLTSSEPYHFLELKQESTNTRLRFIIEG